MCWAMLSRVKLKVVERMRTSHLEEESIWLLIGGETPFKMSQQKPLNNFSIERLLHESVRRPSSTGQIQQTSTQLNLPSSTHALKGQRRRSTFSALQVHVLENEFFKHRYVSAEKRAGLAAFLGLSQQQIKIWFQNRRYKTKVKNGSGRRLESQSLSRLSGQPIVNVPLQSTNPSIFPAWLLQRRAAILAELARQTRQRTPISSDQCHLQPSLSPSKTQ